MRDQALVENTRNKQNHNLVLRCQGNDSLAARDSADQEHVAARFDLAGLADQHYAISEQLVEQSRREHHGNWVEDKQANFASLHGDLIECEKDDMWSDDDNIDDEDNEKCCHGVCVKQICRNQQRFDEMKNQCLALLRMLRAARREKGYLPDHGLLLVLRTGSHDLLQAHLMGNVSFSPFDFTGVHMQPAEHPGVDGTLKAEIVVVDGTAVIQTMTTILHALASQTNICLGTAKYKATGLGCLQILTDTQQTLAQLQAGVHGVGGMARRGGAEVLTSDEDDEFGRRHGLLKRALGLTQPKQKAKAKGKSKSSAAKKRAAAPARGRPSANQQPSRTARAIAADEHADNEIADQWASAVEAELGIVLPSLPPEQSEPASSSRSAPAPPACTGAGSDPMHLPQHVPWKDADGHVFVMMQRDGELRKKHLGHLVGNNLLRVWSV